MGNPTTAEMVEELVARCGSYYCGRMIPDELAAMRKAEAALKQRVRDLELIAFALKDKYSASYCEAKDEWVWGNRHYGDWTVPATQNDIPELNAALRERLEQERSDANISNNNS